MDSEAVLRWVDELEGQPVSFAADMLSARTFDAKLIAPLIFRVADAAQQLHAVAVSRVDRHLSDFKQRVTSIVEEVATRLNVHHQSDVALPIMGGLQADHVIATPVPLIVIAANSQARLLEAEVIYMQYRAEKRLGVVLAVAESQNAVTRRQYERAAYFTDKTVIFDADAFQMLLSNQAQQYAH